MFRYRINYYNELEKESMSENGIIAATSYGDAVEKIVDFYGRDNVNSVGLYELNEILTEDEIHEEFEGEFNL